LITYTFLLFVRSIFKVSRKLEESVDIKRRVVKEIRKLHDIRRERFQGFIVFPYILKFIFLAFLNILNTHLKIKEYIRDRIKTVKRNIPVNMTALFKLQIQIVYIAISQRVTRST